MSANQDSIISPGQAKTKQGQNSKTTPKKERLFECMMERSLNIYKLKDWPFIICDGFSGCGVNDLAGCDGSPLIIDRLLRRHQIPPKQVDVVFIDKDEQAIKALLPLLERSLYFPCYRFINAEFERSIGLWLPNRHRHGFVLVDPNNPNQFPLKTLLDISEQAPKLDIILSYPSQILKRVRAVAKNENGLDSDAWKGWQSTYLHDLIYQIKPVWHTSELIRGNHGWIVLFGSTIQLSCYAKQGIFSADSSRGRDILERASNSKKELKTLGGKTQPDLFDGV